MKQFVVPGMICIAVLIVTAVLICRAIRKKKDSGLILDNPILHVRSAGKIIVISCFGVLIGNKSIPFNHRGILLKKVVLTSGSITLTYGNERRESATRILCSHMTKEEMNAVSEKFLYETGVSPEIEDL